MYRGGSSFTSPLTMTTFEEVEALGDKPFTAPESSNLQRVPTLSEMAKNLGISEVPTPTEDEVPAPEKEAGVEKYVEKAAEKTLKAEEVIQQAAEKLYHKAEQAALADDSYLPTLLESKADRKLGEKILLRNADTFGASSPEEFKKAHIQKTVDDPVQQKIALQEVEIQTLKSGQQEADWSSWKREQKVSGETEKLADEIRSQYPTMSKGDVLALARGKQGITQTPQGKAATSSGPGSSGVPEEDTSILSSPLARRLLHDPASTLKFAKQYMGSL